MMKQKRLSNKEIRLFLKEINSKYDLDISKKNIFEIVNVNENTILMIDNKPCFFYYENKAVPTLKFLENNRSNIKAVIVDAGAIKFVINGADIMRAGVVDVDDDIEKGSIIMVKEETYKKTLAIGKALGNSDWIKEQKSGKVISNIHRVGDEIYKIN